MGLEGDEDPAPAAPLADDAARGGHSGGDLPGMVGVVVDHLHPGRLPREIEATGGTGEGAQPLGEGGHRGVGGGQRGTGEGTDGVERIVVPGDLQGETDLPAVGGIDLEAGAGGGGVLAADPPGGVGGGAVTGDADPARGGALPQGSGAGVIGADDQTAARGETSGQGVEGGGQGLGIAMEVEVVGLEVGDHQHLGAEGEEGAVGLVGLDHGQVTGAEPRIAAQVRDGGAERPGGVLPRSAQGHRGQTGGGGLAVGAGDRDLGSGDEEPGERRGAVDHGDAPLPRGEHLRIVPAHGGGDDHEIEVCIEERGVEADADAGPGRAQRRDELAVLGVRSGDRQSCFESQAGHGGHPGAADAHHVHRADLPVDGPFGLGDDGAGAQDGAGRGGGFGHAFTVVRGERRPGRCRP